MNVLEHLSIEEKLAILSDAAKYDVACTSSGVKRQGDGVHMGSTVKDGICHSFSADGRCISLLKILFTNECIFDCKYCVNRCSNDVARTSFTPEEVCSLTMEFYRRNYIEGLFLSSGILKNPNYTMEQIYQTLVLLRQVHQFQGYIHVKAIPGADPLLIEKTGWLADRMSVNLELPTAESLRTLAPHKSRKTILKPMKQIQLGIGQHRMVNGIGTSNSDQQLSIGDSILSNKDEEILKHSNLLQPNRIHLPIAQENKTHQLKQYKKKQTFVPAGQSTQMIVGATKENDYQIISVAQSLYDKFNLKRVFYSGYIPINEDSLLPDLSEKPPMLREHRLYQADWLLRFYGFRADEILSEKRPNFNIFLDPKCNWALSHLEHFPIEINRANYYTLLRVPGIGTKSARRIVRARQMATLQFTDLKKMGVVLKRAVYFITCNGKMMLPVKLEEDYITRKILEGNQVNPYLIGSNDTYQQLSLFDTDFTNNMGGYHETNTRLRM